MNVQPTSDWWKKPHTGDKHTGRMRDADEGDDVERNSTQSLLELREQELEELRRAERAADASEEEIVMVLSDDDAGNEVEGDVQATGGAEDEREDDATMENSADIEGAQASSGTPTENPETPGDRRLRGELQVLMDVADEDDNAELFHASDTDEPEHVARDGAVSERQPARRSVREKIQCHVTLP